MTGEQILFTDAPAAVVNLGIDSSIRRQKRISNKAAACVLRRYSCGEIGDIPSKQFSLLYPVGSEFRNLFGNDEQVEVELAVGLNFGARKVTDSATHRSQGQRLKKRFTGVSKVALLPDDRHSVEVGYLPDGSSAQGVPLASYALGLVDCGVSGSQELQSLFETNYFFCMGALVDAACRGSQNEPEIRERLGLLEDNTASLRPITGGNIK